MVDGYILLGRQHLRNDYDDNIIMEKVFHSLQEAIKASYQIYNYAEKRQSSLVVAMNRH